MEIGFTSHLAATLMTMAREVERATEIGMKEIVDGSGAVLATTIADAGRAAH